MAHKIVEFKLTLTPDQEAQIDCWLDALRILWNEGLSLLEEDQQRRWRAKCDRPLPDSLRLKWKRGRLVGIGIQKTRDGAKYCKIRQHRTVENPKKRVMAIRSEKNFSHPGLAGVPAVYRNGLIQDLMQSWKNYLDPSHPSRRIKFKGKRDKLRSLINGNGATTTKVMKLGANAVLNIPFMKGIRVKGYFKRFPDGLEFGSTAIVKEPSGCYLHLTIESEVKPLPASDRAVGVDPGVRHLIALDSGKLVPSARHLSRRDRQLKQLQRKANRQVNGSNSQQKTRKRIARLHEKIRRSRNAYNHKVSTRLVKEYGAIAFENVKLQNITRAPKAKPNEAGTGYERNGARAKAGLNRAILDQGVGDLRLKTKTKALARDREFVLVEPQFTSQTCNACGVVDKSNRKDEKFLCVSCGHSDHADVNAAKNILQRGLTDFVRSYPGWTGKVKSVEPPKVDAVKPEPQGSDGRQPIPLAQSIHVLAEVIQKPCQLSLFDDGLLGTG